MGHIFISYSHRDKPYVHKLAEILQKENFEVWIDDRIDYGTRWPMVIEDAVDNCESFILVASRNSHESTWVQHEFARAQRLQKKIFPLLLDGDAWLPFESIQYFDVRDGTLPNQKFYDALRAVENGRFAYLREYVSDLWPIYRNEHYGFSVQYPKGEKAEERANYFQVDLPGVEGTDVENRFLSIYCKEDGNLSNNNIRNSPWSERSSFVDVLGVTFLREHDWEGGMSRTHSVTSFSTQRQHIIVNLTFHLVTVAPDAFYLGPGVIVEIDKKAAADILLGVVSSFRWLY
jgi:hypothetical protein